MQIVSRRSVLGRTDRFSDCSGVACGAAGATCATGATLCRESGAPQNLRDFCELARFLQRAGFSA